jgi:HEAT repeats
MPLVRKRNEADSSGTGASPPALESALATERWSAARSAETPADVVALARALAVEREPRVREAMFTALARIATYESATVAASHLSSDDAALRTGAMDALRAMPQASEPLVPQLLADADADVRVLACELVRNVGQAKGQRWLCQRLDLEGHANVCAAAVEVLAEIGDRDALPALARCAERFRDAAFLSFAITAAADGLRARPSSL